MFDFLDKMFDMNHDGKLGSLEIYMYFMIIMIVALPGVGLIMLEALIWFWMCGGL